VIIFVLLLLALPTFAILRLARIFDLRVALGYAILISVVTYLLYRHDKKRAQSGGWRIPESTLHIVELLGGWPGAFIAQRALRHKTSKRSYQVTFWAIISLYEFASFDFIQDWHYSKKLLLLFFQ
jgi:uncharacterized membrane protein YsdA (DUF1294 family)